MSTQTQITRRQLLSAVIVGTGLQGPLRGADSTASVPPADPKIRGPFPILTTPFTATGAVDFDVLAAQARFVDWGGCAGEGSR